MRVFGLIALTIVLFASLFHIFRADLNNNVLAVSLMVLLISLFSDLKEFNFWGLTGKSKEEQKLKEVVGKEAIADDKKTPKIKPAVFQQAKETVEQLMDNDKANFLALAFEIEKLLRAIASVLSNKKIAANSQFSDILNLLDEKAIFTKDGRQQIESIRWMRNMLVHGRGDELSKDIVQTGYEVAKDFYEDVKNWLEHATTKAQK